MVIDSNNSIKPGSTSSSASRTASANTRQTEAKAGAESTTQAREEVVLSKEAQSLGRLEDKINSLPEVNSERVAEIRQAISEGRFQINAQRIAENMLNQDDLLS